MKYNKRSKKRIAVAFFTIMLVQTLAPNVALALTTGPSQPEMQGFEPVGTTDMVDMFSGDFVYNIPLMDVEGYPVNISYHGGVTMEQEASWVGLGWNINPGEINRTVRGIPDDFKGDTLSKELNILDDKTLRVGIGVGAEAFGVGDPWMSLSASLGANVTFNNYRGTSVDFDLGCGINLFHCASMGVNIGVGSATGADIDYNANLSISSSQIVSADVSGGVGVGVSQGISSRTGLKATSFSISANASSSSGGTGMSMTKSVPIGIQNFVPVITNSNTMNSIYGRVKLGGELFWFFGYGTANGMFSRVHFNNDGTREAYGYMHLQDVKGSENRAILDFTRDKDGQFNKSMQYLPPASLTYDLYTVSGQGTGGMFRPYRNDVGTVYDPTTSSEDHSYSMDLEGGLGWIFEGGGDYTNTHTEVKSGPWEGFMRGFKGRTPGSLYEDVYLKEGGELTSVNPQFFAGIGRFEAMGPAGAVSIAATKPNSSVKRDPRANLVYYNTAEEASISGVGSNPNIISYTSTNGFSDGAEAPQTVISRTSANPLGHKNHEISEVVQVQKNGKKYIYGIPALNHIQKEATFSVDPPAGTDLSKGLAGYSPGSDDGTGNSKGMDHYYSATITPSFAHSYLLTAVESPDYLDVTGNGITDDDLGSYTKMNYTLKDPDYRWKAPFETGKAQYNPGFWSDRRDDKGMYISGSREQWMLHSIETKNFVAEFYTSERNDGCGSKEAIFTSGCYNMAPYNAPKATAGKSYKLDSIKLYNKHDRFINKTAAVPVKTVFFVYNDDLCKGIPNVLTGAGSAGKLTLSKIYFRYGNSEKSMISPYQFSYGYNPNYDLACKDRWGNYKPAPAGTTNYEFPFVDQDDASNDTYAGAWSLTNITLPSGGVIQADYEADDYGYVQDKIANEMFTVKGLGFFPFYAENTYLYDEYFPFLYVFFKRRQSAEKSGLSLAENYLPDNIFYYNFRVRLAGGLSTSYEQIKGYANAEEVGICPNNHDYGYIKLTSVKAKGGKKDLNPITYTAINTARYSLPQVIFGGTSDPDGFGILDGLKDAFRELVDLFKGTNIIDELTDKKHFDAMDVDIAKSFVRLQSPGLMKKGGGQRVKSLMFYDSWSKLAGSNEQNATYGKTYDYTIKDSKFGTISSGVASYEPQIGGDENPWRQPVSYLDKAGSNWPPNDPVSLYQEMPIGESLFPSPTVGYRQITVKSIHANVGKSSQGIDIYKFYTARDFPVQVKATAINSSYDSHFDFFSQKVSMNATQGYSLVFNDMHGKPKSVEHYVHRMSGGANQLISYQQFNYKTQDGLLDNNVNCIAYNPGTKYMSVSTKELGIEADVTFDSRQRDEHTKTNTYNFNMNISGFLFIIIPIFLPMHYKGDYRNNFTSGTVTKVVQQYGILDNVQSYNDGAVTVQRNEIFDPETGQVVVTSVNNEYKDKEFSVSIPAYWAYQAMAPSYNNIKYETVLSTINIDGHDLGSLGSASPAFNTGDQLLLEYTASGVPYQTIVWCMGAGNLPFSGGGSSPCGYLVLPRYPGNTPGWTGLSSISNVHAKVINTGCKNMLNETIENYTMMDSPIDMSSNLKMSLKNVIDIKGRTFSDSNTMILRRFIANSDTINPYAIGERGIYRPLSEYVYVADRKYAGTTSRNSGLFDVLSFLAPLSYQIYHCIPFPSNYVKPDFTINANWRVARTVSKWSPVGKELENVDAVGNFSSAVYGYNEELPVAVASNARQGEVLTDGFEDYSLLHYKNNLLNFRGSPFGSYFATTPLGTSPLYDLLNLTSSSGLVIANTCAHTGFYSLSVPSSAGTGGVSGAAFGVPIPMNSYAYSTTHSYYNSYYPGTLRSPTFTANSEYLAFGLNNGDYVVSFWVKAASPGANPTTYSFSDSCGMKINTTSYKLAKKSNIIEGWQQVEAAFSVPSGTTSATLRLPINYFVDDIRIFPVKSNMKAFVYNPVNEKLMSTLDENNFSTFYEYDQEGNLVRVKKETEKGILTVSESRSNNPKQ